MQGSRSKSSVHLVSFPEVYASTHRPKLEISFNCYAQLRGSAINGETPAFCFDLVALRLANSKATVFPRLPPPRLMTS